MTDANVKLYFKLKKANKENINLSAGEFILRSHERRKSKQRRFVQKFCEEAYKDSKRKTFLKEILAYCHLLLLKKMPHVKMEKRRKIKQLKQIQQKKCQILKEKEKKQRFKNDFCKEALDTSIVF